MKRFMMAAAACTLLAGCATGSTGTSARERGNQVAQEDENYTPTGSNIPRKKGQGTSSLGTMSAVELESARMDPGKAPEMPAGQ